MVRSLERKTRDVVEAERDLARLRVELDGLRAQLLAAIGGGHHARPPLSEISDTVIEVARIVDAAPEPITRNDVAAALGITLSSADRRLLQATKRNLVEKMGRGRYWAVGRRGDEKISGVVQ